MSEQRFDRLPFSCCGFRTHIGGYDIYYCKVVTHYILHDGKRLAYANEANLPVNVIAYCKTVDPATGALPPCDNSPR